MSAWMQVFQLVENPPDGRNPPPGWQDLVIKPGTWVQFYAYEHWQKKFDWTTGQFTDEDEFVWKRACFWVPRGKYDLMRLGMDGTWKCIGIYDFPDGAGYFDLDSIDGAPVVNGKDTGNGGSLRLMAHVADET